MTGQGSVAAQPGPGIFSHPGDFLVKPGDHPAVTVKWNVFYDCVQVQRRDGDAGNFRCVWLLFGRTGSGLNGR